jgi:hypothetical protein
MLTTRTLYAITHDHSYALQATCTSSVLNLASFCRLSGFQGTEEKIPLRASTLSYWSLKAHAVTQKPGLRDHNAVVDAEPVSR